MIGDQDLQIVSAPDAVSAPCAAPDADAMHLMMATDPSARHEASCLLYAPYLGL